MIKTEKRVAIVATGDELINGDILNTNSQYFRHQLVESGMTPGCEILVSDDLDEITHAITDLLANHSAVITIGGLGPTSDDKTRFGLAKAINQKLEFNQQAWQWIVDLLSSKGLNIPETNRQQALLPKSADPIFNANGTACACYVEHAGKDIFMLPGPPNECRPIFDNIVIEKLAQKNYSSELYKKSWLLFAVSESDIASKVEPLMQDYPECELGFRVHYPYLEVKLFSQDKKKLEALADIFLKIIGDKVVSENRQVASQQLLELINHSKSKINIIDHATGGLLEHTLSSPKNHGFLMFGKQPDDKHFDQSILIEGLTDYWQGAEHFNHLPLQITLHNKNSKEHIEKKVPNRGNKTLTYALEIIALTLVSKL